MAYILKNLSEQNFLQLFLNVYVIQKHIIRYSNELVRQGFRIHLNIMYSEKKSMNKTLELVSITNANGLSTSENGFFPNNVIVTVIDSKFHLIG